MKKILNAPGAYVDEMLEGLCAAHPEAFELIGDDRRVVVRASRPASGKVAIVTGGGSGHLPIFLGYIGRGLIDGCAVGNVFAGPRVADCQLAMQHCDGGAWPAPPSSSARSAAAWRDWSMSTRLPAPALLPAQVLPKS